MKEIWKDIEGYEGRYQVSNTGKVKSLRAKLVMKQKTNNCGYSEISLCVSQKRKSFLVHRLVALAFLPNYDNKKQVNHIDGNKKNNHTENLEWCTASGNMRHSLDMGLRDFSHLRGSRHYGSKLSVYQVLTILTLKNHFKSGQFTKKQVSELYGIDRRSVCSISRRLNWKDESIFSAIRTELA